MSISNDQLHRLMPRLLRDSAGEVESGPRSVWKPVGESGSVFHRGEIVDDETGQIFSTLVYAVIAQDEAGLLRIANRIRPPKQEDAS